VEVKHLEFLRTWGPCSWQFCNLKPISCTTVIFPLCILFPNSSYYHYLSNKKQEWKHLLQRKKTYFQTMFFAILQASLAYSSITAIMHLLLQNLLFYRDTVQSNFSLYVIKQHWKLLEIKTANFNEIYISYFVACPNIPGISLNLNII